MTPKQWAERQRLIDMIREVKEANPSPTGDCYECHHQLTSHYVNTPGCSHIACDCTNESGWVRQYPA